MADENNNICNKLYEYLTCNDTIHDFGKGADRGIDIRSIVEKILIEPFYKEYTPFGNNKNITLSNFERSVEEFILYNCDLPGIPESVLAQSPYFISPNLGDPAGTDVKDVAIYRFINRNKNVNYGIKLFSYQVLGLTDIQRKNILEEPSNIDPAISFFSTIIIEDQYDPNGIRKLFNWMEDELNLESNKLTSLLPNSVDRNGRFDIKKNKIGDFLIKTFFYAGEGSDYKGFIYNTDAVAGNLKCAFSAFNNNVLGGVKDTTNYGDSAGTEETGGDEEDSGSKKGKVSTCGKNKKTKVGNNLFDLVVGFFNIEQTQQGRLSIQVSENPDDLPSLFPASNGEPKGRKVYFFSNNFFTKDNFTIAYVENRDKNWKPYFQPYNFSLCIYSGSKSPELVKQIQNNPEDSTILIAEAPFTSGDNGPSVVYLKELIDAVNISTTQQNLETGINNVIPEGKVLNINQLIIDIYKKIPGTTTHGDKKTILIKLLLDLKRCGDFEQVDAIRMIQDQNEGTNNRFGLQDILFTTGDRLCSLYSRFKNTNVQFFVAGTQRYYLYRQPYIYPSDEVRLLIDQQNIFNELKQKAIRAGSFMQKINILKDFEIENYYRNNQNLKNLMASNRSFIRVLFEYIFLFQKNRLIYLKQIVDKIDLTPQIKFCEKLGETQFNQVSQKESTFYFNNQSTILNIKYKKSVNPVDCNALINNFYYLASSEIFSDITSNENQYLDMDIIKGKFKIPQTIPQTNTVLLFDFLQSGDITDKLNQYYTNFYTVYGSILKAYNNIKITGSKRSLSVSVIDYLKYSSIVITFLQLCNLIFGSIDIVNEKISNLVNINNTLKVLLIQKYEAFGQRSLPSLTTPQTSVDLTSIKEDEVKPPAMPEPDIFEPSQDTFKDIVDKIKEQNTFQNVEENKIQINETKQTIKEQKQQQQKEKQDKKEQKKKNKMQRAVRKIEALNALNAISGVKNKLISKGKLFKQGLRNSGRISILERKSSLRSSSPPRELGTAPNFIQGGGKIQKGGGVIDSFMGNKLEELYQDVNIIAFMNQIYSNLMPYELLLILLTEFDIEYSGVSDASGKMKPLSELPANLSNTTPDYYPMVLSRGEYLLKFQTELSNLIRNENIGLEPQEIQMLKMFTDESAPFDEINEEYNTEELEKILGRDNFDLTPIIQQMENMVLSKKNVPCFLLQMNSNEVTKIAISNYLKGMSETWLTILISINKDDIFKDINIFEEIPIPRTYGTTDKRNALENMHLITILLTIHSTETGCQLINPFPDNGIITPYLTKLNEILELNTYCNPRNVPVRQSARFYGDLAIIKNIIKMIRTINKVDLQIIIIYVLSILGAVLFDVTKLYFPNKEKTYRKQILNIIRPQVIGLTGQEKTIIVSNEEIFRFLSAIVGNILILLPNDDNLNCYGYLSEDNIDNPDIKLPRMKDNLGEKKLELEEDNKTSSSSITGPVLEGTHDWWGNPLDLGGGRKKTKKNRKHSKNRSLRFK